MKLNDVYYKMEIGLGVGIPLLVLLLVAGGVYIWGKTTLTGYILLGGLTKLSTHASRKQKRNANMAEIATILAETGTSDNRETTQTRLRAAETAILEAEEALRKASEAENKASEMARTVRHSNTLKGNNPDMALRKAQEDAERAVTEATRAYITASHAKNRALTLRRRAQNDDHQIPRENIRNGFRGEKKEEERLYNADEVFLRKDRRKNRRNQKRT